MTNDIAQVAKGVIKIAGVLINLEKINQHSPDLYIALSPSTTRFQFQEAKRRGFRFIASSDNSYPQAADRDFYRVALGKRAALATYPQHILSDKEWRVAVAPLTDDKMLIANALKNRDAAMAQCNAALKPAKLLVPRKPRTLRQMCEAGAVELGIDLSDQIYRSRLEHELSVIDAMSNEDYFYIVADLMQYARKNAVCGPGRGSSSGSLVCFLLGITEIDPIKFSLIFERFLDQSRTDWPDIDVDVQDDKRKLMIEYLQKRYGKDHVAKLGNLGTFGARSALNQVCKSLNIPKWKCEEALSQIILRNDGDSRALNCLEDTLTLTTPGKKFLAEHPETLIASKLEGHPSYAGTHAGGILITKDPIADHMAVNNDGTAQADMKSAEFLGCLKIDLLGVTQLSVFNRTMELVK